MRSQVCFLATLLLWTPQCASCSGRWLSPCHSLPSFWDGYPRYYLLTLQASGRIMPWGTLVVERGPTLPLSCSLELWEWVSPLCVRESWWGQKFPKLGKGAMAKCHNWSLLQPSWVPPWTDLQGTEIRNSPWMNGSWINVRWAAENQVDAIEQSTPKTLRNAQEHRAGHARFTWTGRMVLYRMRSANG